MHLAHNPLDTLREEEDFPEGTNYTSGAIHALEMLNQVGSKLQLQDVFLIDPPPPFS